MGKTKKTGNLVNVVVTDNDNNVTLPKALTLGEQPLLTDDSLKVPTTSWVNDKVEDKVDKVTGKGLSTNDFTDTLKTKLDGIEAGAEVNVNADWDATSGDAQILNKPTIPAAQVNSDWDATTGVAQILNKPTIPSITGFVPYTGATANVDLGTHTLLAKDLVINHSSGSGVAASITKNGNGEALTVIKGSGSGNAMSVTGGLTSLVNLSLSTVANATGDFLTHSGSTINKRTPAQVLSDIGGQAALTNPITGTGANGQVAFWNGTNSQTGDSGLVWDNVNKRLGINVANPLFDLQVNGSVRFGSSTILDNNTYFDNTTFRLGIGVVSPTRKLDVVDNASALVANFRSASGNISAISLSNNASTADQVRFGSNGGNLTLSTNFTERFRIVSNGNILINTTTDAGFRLDVNGTARITSTLNTDADAVVNGVNIGRGGGAISSNTRVGAATLASNTTGSFNASFSNSALRLNTTGSANSAFGAETLENNTTGIGNSGFGSGSLRFNTTGSLNSALGRNAGRFIADGTTSNTITTNSIYIGFNTKALADNQTNQIVIGHDATGLGSNTTVLGNSSTLSTAIYGDLLLGQTTDNGTDRLQITGSARVSSSITAGSFIRSGGTSAQYLMADGSVSTLSNPITGTGTTNFLPKFTGASTLGNSLIFDNGTNVGIGTTSPVSKLQVVGDGLFSSSTNTALTVSSSGGVALINLTTGAGTQAIYGGVGGSNVMDFYTNSAFRMRIDASGNVGIGTTSPDQRLHVVAPAGYISKFSNNSSNNERLEFYVDGGEVSLVAGYNTTAKPFKIYTGGSERMQITSGGNVGIGTTSPSQKLDVNGNVLATSFIRSGGTSSQFLKADGSVDSSTYLTGITSSQVTTALGFTPVTQARTLTINGTSFDLSTDRSWTISANTGSLEFNATDLTVWNNGKGDNSSNTSFGELALKSNTEGLQNSAFGLSSLENNTTGNQNSAFGINSLYNNTEGSRNVAFGSTAVGGFSGANSSVNDNVGIGSGALNGIISSDKNVAIGSMSATNFNTIQNSVFLGYNTLPLANAETNQIVIGYNAIGNGSNSVTLGNNDITKTILNGNVGIGTTSPTSKLHVTGLPEYATNALAISGGLTVGAFYHTAGVLKVVI